MQFDSISRRGSEPFFDGTETVKFNYYIYFELRLVRFHPLFKEIIIRLFRESCKVIENDVNLDNYYLK